MHPDPCYRRSPPKLLRFHFFPTPLGFSTKPTKPWKKKNRFCAEEMQPYASVPSDGASFSRKPSVALTVKEGEMDAGQRPVAGGGCRVDVSLGGSHKESRPCVHGWNKKREKEARWGNTAHVFLLKDMERSQVGERKTWDKRKPDGKKDAMCWVLFF